MKNTLKYIVIISIILILSSHDQTSGSGLLDVAATTQIIEDFEDYSVNQTLDGQGGWVAQNSCNIIIKNADSPWISQIAASNSCSPAQYTTKDYPFKFSPQSGKVSIAFTGRITAGTGNNSNSLIYIGSGSDDSLQTAFGFGLTNTPVQGLIHPGLRVFSPQEIWHTGPNLIPGEWYDFRLSLDWGHVSSSEGYGIATMSYKAHSATEWQTSENLTNVELQVESPDELDTIGIRMDGIASRRGEMDNITISLEDEFNIELEWSRSKESVDAVARGRTLGSAISKGLILPIDKNEIVFDNGTYTGESDKVKVPNGHQWASWPMYDYDFNCQSGFEARHFQSKFIMNSDLNEIVSIALFSPYYTEHGNIIPVNDNVYIYLNGTFVSQKGGDYGATSLGFDGTAAYANESGGWIQNGDLGIDALRYLIPGKNTIDLVLEDRCKWGGLGKLDLKFVTNSTINSSEILAAYYPYEGNANDHSGNENHGTVNSPTLTFDIYGNGGRAYEFDGTNDSISAGPVTLNREHSLSAWVRVDSLDPDPDNVIIENTDSETIADYGLYAEYQPDSPDRYKFYYFLRGSDEQPYEIIANTLYETKRWYHVVGTYDGNVARLFVDGVQVASQQLDITLRQAATTFVMGNDGPNGDAGLDGRLDEIRLYNRALNVDEIRTLQYKPDIPTEPDSDGDGLLDSWEINGYDPNGDGIPEVDLPAMGADPQHKDIFVEVDYMENLSHSHRPDLKAIQAIVRAFNNAPIPNLNDETGIHLHVDFGPDAPLTWGQAATWGSLSNSQAIIHQDNVSTCDISGDRPLLRWAGFDTIKDSQTDSERNFSENRRNIFHYNLWVHRLCLEMGNAGISRNMLTEPEFAMGGSDFIVSFGDTSGTLTQQAATFMHELGHNLGLRHGGPDHWNYKPNYLSVMNYMFAMRGLHVNGQHPIFDYSRYSLPALDEKSLNESIGIQIPSSIEEQLGTYHFCGFENIQFVDDARTIDWNCDEDTQDANVEWNINQGMEGAQDSQLNELLSHNDWDNIRFTGGSIGDLGVPLAQVSEIIDITFEEDALIPDYPSILYLPLVNN